MIGLWYRYKARRRERELLLVCAGSEPGRAPFAMVTRKAGAAARISGREISIDSSMDDGTHWHITIIAKSDQLAQELVRRLAVQELYEVHPDARIHAILFRRDDWGPEPLWIGGDPALAEISPSDYVRNGNRAYIHRKLAEQSATFWIGVPSPQPGSGPS